MSTWEKIQFDSVGQSKEDPIMNAIDKNSLEWHGISAENMYIYCFVLTLDVMQDGHG